MFRPRVNLLGAFARGLVAGAAGAGAQRLFFKVTKESAPRRSNGASAASPPGGEESSAPAEEMEMEKPREETKSGSSVRHRIGKWLKEEPFFSEATARQGELIHYAIGALWGGVYGLARESRSHLLHGPLGAAGFCATASTLSQHLILPLLPPAQRPGSEHNHAWAGDIVYGTVVPALYEAMRPQRWAEARSAVWVRRMQHDLSRRLPDELHPAIGPILEALAALRELASAARSRVQG